MSTADLPKSFVRSFALLFLVVSLCACIPQLGTSSQDLPTSTVATEAPSRATATAIQLQSATLASPATLQDIPSMVQIVTASLQASSANSLSPLLWDEVWLAQGPLGDQGQSIQRAKALQWLNTRWGNARRVVSTNYVDHTVQLEIMTSGWANIAPLQRGIIEFHLHRYDPQGQADPNHGDWRIDVLIYQ